MENLEYPLSDNVLEWCNDCKKWKKYYYDGINREFITTLRITSSMCNINYNRIFAFDDNEDLILFKLRWKYI